MDESRFTEIPADVITQALQTLDIETSHSPASLAETQHWLTHSGLDDPTLTDLTSLPFVTIDNPDSRDLDQALLIERHGSTGYRLRYALADASYYVKPGSALFKEALARGTTYYTPIIAVPMLPVELSEGLMSLNPNVDRRALVFDITLHTDGSINTTHVEKAKIHSHAKLNYAGVQAWLDSGANPTQVYDESLLLLQELGNILIDAAAQRGVVRFNRTESHISIEGNPPRFSAAARTRYQTEQYNEQISLICNMQGAEMMLALEGVSDALQAIYRVHEAPLKKSLGELRNTLETFAEHQPEPQHWRWNNGQSLADYVENLPQGPDNLRRVKSVQRQIMQAQRASSFTPVAGEHHALKAASYARFSSPMREVVGIYTHKELLEALGGHPFDNEADLSLREAVIESANSARQRQRKLEKIIEFEALFSLFSRELESPAPPIHTGTIMGLRADKLYITLDDLAVDIKLYKEDIQTQFATVYTMTNVSAIPESEDQPSWQMGQAVEVQIHTYDKERKRFQFTMRSTS